MSKTVYDTRVYVMEREHKDGEIGEKEMSGKEDHTDQHRIPGIISSGYSCVCPTTGLLLSQVWQTLKARGRATQSAVKVKCFCCLIACFTAYPY